MQHIGPCVSLVIAQTGTRRTSLTMFRSDVPTYLPSMKHIALLSDVCLLSLRVLLRITLQFVSFSLWLHYPVFFFFLKQHFYVYGMFFWKELWGET